MAGFTITSTNHTSFTVSSLDRAIGLFRDALGFELLNRSPRDPKFIEQVVGVEGADIEVAYLQAPGHRLELIEYRGPADRGRVESRPCDAGFAHIAFDVDDIHEAIAAVRDAGSEPLGAPITVNGAQQGRPRSLYPRPRRHHGRVHSEAEGVVFYETARNDHGLPHDPFKSCVVPRPIGWITTLDNAGLLNLAPFSYFNACGDHPPQVMYAPSGSHAEGGAKDSLHNVQETGEFVASLATWEQREAMRISSSHVLRSVDEFALAGLETEPARLVRPPRVKGAPIHLECRLHKVIELLADDPGRFRNWIVLGQVVGVHIDESIITDGRVDQSKFRPIARLGYADYTTVDSHFEMPFPD